jgi:hypothetical protein
VSQTSTPPVDTTDEDGAEFDEQLRMSFGSDAEALAMLRTSSVIASLRHGLDTLLANAFFYPQPSLLVLDEPTSALDARGEARVVRGAARSPRTARPRSSASRERARRQWDQATIAFQSDTLAEPPAYWEEFRDAYGTDVTAWDGYALIRDIRSLGLALFALRHADTSEHARSQADYQFACLMGRHGGRPWKWVAP